MKTTNPMSVWAQRDRRRWRRRRRRLTSELTAVRRRHRDRQDESCDRWSSPSSWTCPTDRTCRSPCRCRELSSPANWRNTVGRSRRRPPPTQPHHPSPRRRSVLRFVMRSFHSVHSVVDRGVLYRRCARRNLPQSCTPRSTHYLLTTPIWIRLIKALVTPTIWPRFDSHSTAIVRATAIRRPTLRP